MANRLAHATSPYLLQHANNPVDWWEWNSDAFASARERDVPVLLSVGYAACHWCHVMAHESFEDAGIAELLNESFVAIKVDREERPDVDAVYMQATQDLTGSGGWPMTVFLDHDGRPFYAGTYYPPEPRSGMPSFRQVLEAITDAWHNRRSDLAESARSITASLANRPVGIGSGETFDATVADNAIALLASQFDDQRGGFTRSAPKFPPSPVLQFLSRHAGRTGSETALRMLDGTCEAMIRGGLYDQLGGGFARYSVDAAWVVPHFEKMLYDNAQLLSVYTAWCRHGGGHDRTDVVRATAEFMLRELLTDEGGFASSLDADSDGREGAFYVWTVAQLVDVLGPIDGAWAAEWLQVTELGTFEHGTSTLQRFDHLSDAERWESVRSRLFAARELRPRPPRDDKVVTAWNGLAIGALAEAGSVLRAPHWIAAAERCADLIERVHSTTAPDGTTRIVRASRDGIAGTASGVLEDYADLAQGLLTLYAATGTARWVEFAGRLIDTIRAQFDADDGSFYDTAADAERLVQRPRDPADNAYPSGLSAAAGALLTYGALTGDVDVRARAAAALDSVMPLLTQAPRFAGWALAVGEALLDGPREVAIVGPAGDPARTELEHAVWMSRAPGLVLATGEPSGADPSPAVELLRDRVLFGGAPAAYVCRHFVCQRPVAEPAALRVELGDDDW